MFKIKQIDSHFQICQTRTYEDPSVLVPPTPDSHPVTATMYTVVIQATTPQNDPPELETEWHNMLEDEELTVQLLHYDTADDKVNITALHHRVFCPVGNKAACYVAQCAFLVVLKNIWNMIHTVGLVMTNVQLSFRLSFRLHQQMGQCLQV